MIGHPTLIAVLALDILALLLFAGASASAVRIMLYWAPAAHDFRQIRLERSAESAVLKTRAAELFFISGTVLWILAVTNQLPILVPGAMCGTGVFQAMSGIGIKALSFRILTFGVMYILTVTATLDEKSPEGPLTPLTARLILFVLPLVFLSVWYTFSSVLYLNTYQPVDCCAVVYDQFQGKRAGSVFSGVPDNIWVLFSLVLSGIMVLCSVIFQAKVSIWKIRIPVIMAVTGIFWAMVSSIALTKVLSAYYYEVLQHHCPWCMFLSEYHYVGFVMFGAAGFAALESVSAWWAARTARSSDTLHPIGLMRARKAGLRVVFAIVVFWVLAGGPSLIWRIRHGVWMGG